MILRFKPKKVLDLLQYFSKLSEVDKLRLTYNLLESKYLHLEIDKETNLNAIMKRIMALDKDYMSTIMNFNKYSYLTLLSAKFLEMDEFEKNTVVLEMLDKIAFQLAIADLD